MHVLIPAVSRFTQLTGICRHAVNHAKAVADLPDTRVTLIVGRWQELYFRKALQNAKVRVAVADCSNSSLSRNLWYSRTLPQIASRMKADIVHLAYPVPIVRWRFSVPVLTTVHDLYPYDTPENFGFPNVLFNRMMLKKCIAECDTFACVSEFTRERLAHHFPGMSGKQVVVISSYSELSDVTPSRPQSLSGDRFILTVGQHRANKNIDLIILAYESLTRSRGFTSDLKLVIAGAPGPETQHLKALVHRLTLDSKVRFLSDLSDANLAWLYRNCELFVAASSIEGFCLPLLEASELSPRIVCANIPVFHEVANGSATYFDNTDANALATAMTDALSRRPSVPGDPESRFTRAAATRAYAQLYSLILRQSEPDPVSIAS